MPVFYATLDPSGIESGANRAKKAIKQVGDEFDHMQGQADSMQPFAGSVEQSTVNMIQLAQKTKAASINTSSFQNSVSGLTSSILRGNSASNEQIGLLARGTAELLERIAGYTDLVLAAKQAAQAEREAAAAHVQSLQTRQGEIAGQILERKDTLNMYDSDPYYQRGNKGFWQAFKDRPVIQKQINELEEEGAKIATDLKIANEALALSQLKVGNTAKVPMGAFASLKAGASGLLRLFGGPVGLAVTGATAAITFGISKLMNTQAEAEKTSKAFGFALEGLTDEMDKQVERTEKIYENIRKITELELRLKMPGLEKERQAQYDNLYQTLSTRRVFSNQSGDIVAVYKLTKALDALTNTDFSEFNKQITELGRLRPQMAPSRSDG